MDRFVGRPVSRVEDHRLLCGLGQYVDDIVVPGMLHASFVRSVYPHARLVAVDAAAARKAPGVHLVLTGEDVRRRTYPFFGLLALDGLYNPSFYSLAVDRVRHVGDPVALVVAESRPLAEDAAALVHVEYEALPAIASAEQALDPAAELIWPKAKSNVLYHADEQWGDVGAAFAAADRVITGRFEQHRQSNQPMETRGIVAEVDPTTGVLTIHGSTQSAHALRWAVALLTGRRPVHEVLLRMARQRHRTASIARGVRDYLRATPAMVSALKQLGPAMARQAVTNWERTAVMNAAFLGLVAKGPEELPDVVVGDIGGAFGAKTLVNREDVAVCAAALELRRPVKWIEDRNEHLTVGGQAREESVAVEAAVREDGTVLALRADMVMDAGAYPGFPFGAPVFARFARTLIPGPYRLRALQFRTRIVASNKATYVAYRGPWAIETFVRERLLDTVATEMGISRADVRRRNIITPDDLPATMVTGPALDVRMSAARTLETALDAVDYPNFEKVRAEEHRHGRRLGLGFATFIEPAPGPPRYFDNIAPGFSALADCEPARAVLEADGTITVLTQQVPHGQGHETTLAQVAADELGVPLSAVRVQYGNTRRTPFGLLGTGGSRSATLAGGAVTLASRALRDRITAVAADLLEAAAADVTLADGRAHVQGVPAVAVPLSLIAAEAMRRGADLRGPTKDGEAIRSSAVFDGGEGGWSQATHASVVEVSLETGQVKILRYVVAEDCGELINPAIVDGQIRGGVAQGIGAVLYEKSTYDSTAQFQAATFMDYLIPTAMEIPEIEIHHLETPSAVFANYRGVGEGGMIGAPAALVNAIADALSDLGVHITEQHLPPARILELAGVIPTSRAT